VLIKHPTKFGGFPALTSTKVENDIKFNENLQLSSRLIGVLGVDSVQLKFMRGLFLLPQTFFILLDSYFCQEVQTPIVSIFYFYLYL